MSVGSFCIIHVSTDLIFKFIYIKRQLVPTQRALFRVVKQELFHLQRQDSASLNQQIINPQIISNYFNKAIFWTADAKRFSYEVPLFFRSSSFADQNAMQRSKRKRTPGKSDGPKLTGSLLAKNWLWILRLSLKKEEIYQWSMTESSGKNQVSLFISSTYWVWFDLFYNL